MSYFIRGHAFACPSCGGKMRVTTTRRLIGRVVRYRECATCFRTLRTEETAATGAVKRAGPRSGNLPAPAA